MKDRELLKLFLKNGWHEVRITGSHHILGQTVSIPVHGKDMKKGLEAALLKKAEL